MLKFENLFPNIQIARDGELVIVQHRVDRTVQPLAVHRTMGECTTEVLMAVITLLKIKWLQPITFTALTQQQLDKLHELETQGLVGLNETPQGVLVV